MHNKARLENTINYIKGELDELEMEDFFKLKKIQGSKKKLRDNWQLPSSLPSSSLQRMYLCRKGFQ